MFSLAVLAFLAAVPAPAGPAAKVAVFGVPEDAAAIDAAARVEGRVSESLRRNGVEVVDFDALFPPPPPASLEEGERLFAEAKEAYDNLETELACDKLSAAIKFFQKHPVETDPRRLAEVLLFYGAALLQKGQDASAREAFALALVLDGEARPKSNLFTKKVNDAFTTAREALGSRPKGVLKVDSEPGGARASVGGVDLGLTPAPARWLVAGRHLVIVTRPGYRPSGAARDVTEETPAEPRVRLEPNPGFASVLKAADKVWSAPRFREGTLTPEATSLGGRLDARNLLFVAVSTGNDGKPQAALVAVDLVSGERLKDLRFVVDDDWSKTYAAAEQVEQWLARPPQARPKAQLAESGSVLGKWWLWAAVGGAAAVATGVVVASGGRPFGINLGLGTPAPAAIVQP